MPWASAIANQNPFRSTNYPIPRFVSIIKNKAFVRTGPGKKFPIKWVYTTRGIPVEIILEYDTWRKIRDKDGETGWLHESLLSGKRTGFIQTSDPGTLVKLHTSDKTESRLIAKIESGALIHINECKEHWCEIKAQGYKGWVERKFIWGIYEEEFFD